MTIHKATPDNEFDMFLPPNMGTEEMQIKLQGKLAGVLIGLDSVRKDSVNPAFRSKYASLSAVNETISGALKDAGLALLTSEVSPQPGTVKIAFYILDAESGAKMLVGFSSTYLAGKNKAGNIDAQAIGSAETYALRRGMMAVFSIPSDDDDGAQASPQNQPQRQRPQSDADRLLNSTAQVAEKHHGGPGARVAREVNQAEMAQRAARTASIKVAEIAADLGFDVKNEEGQTSKTKLHDLIRKAMGNPEIAYPSNAAQWAQVEQAIRDLAASGEGAGF